MKKETLGAALFFCGLGILLSLFCPLESWVLRLAVGLVLLLCGLKLGGCGQ